MSRPKFTDLSPEQQLLFGNGVGPFWLPDWARNAITQTASWFFKDASWRHHDFGYVVGGDRWDRARSDWKFLTAMLKDALTQDGDPEAPFGSMLASFITVPLAMFLSFLFYLAVRIGGQFGSFDYRDEYATLDEVLAACECG